MLKYMPKYWLTILGFFLLSTQAVFAEETAPSFALHNLQLARLMHPSTYQVKSEKTQRVYIYIGMKDTDVEQAMDEQFERIENFVFAATIVTDEQGEPLYNKHGHIVTEDDGC